MDSSRPNDGQSRTAPNASSDQAMLPPERQLAHISVPPRTPPPTPVRDISESAFDPVDIPPAVPPLAPPMPQQPMAQDALPPPPPLANTSPIVPQPPRPQPPLTPPPSTPTQAAYTPSPVVPGPQPVTTAAPSNLPTNPTVSRISEVPIQNSSDVIKQAEHKKTIHRLRSFLSFVIFVAGIFVAAFLINQFIFQSYYVEGTSMQPTLQNDDRLIIDKVGRTMALAQGKPYIPARGEIIVLDSSIVDAGGDHEQLIKRVIGLPGETVVIENNTVVIINPEFPKGFKVDESLGLALEETFVGGPIRTTVPEGQVYVMGDNRGKNGSYDSRAFGPITADKIEGRLWARILPITEAQLF